MKYIRTKDGRIIDLSVYKENGVINKGIKFVNKINGSYLFVQQNNILKQSDTIDELCDGFMIVRKDDVETGGDITTFKEMKLQRECDVEYEVEDEYFYYGGIFTEKGFIFVAKLNDKGDFKLL